MIDYILDFSLRQRAIILLATFALLGGGIWSAVNLPIDAVPDITGVQVQINTEIPALAAEESEKLVTRRIEVEMAGLPGMEEMRSLTKFGLSQVTLNFKDGTDIFRARQLVAERLQGLVEELPAGARPKLSPISTGLGEIFYYNVQYRPDAKKKPATELEQLIELSEIQEYTIKPLLRTVPGIAEINESGGYEKQFVIHPNPEKLARVNMTFSELADLVAQNVQNAGGGIISRDGQQLTIRAVSRVATTAEIENLPLKFGAAVKPLLVKDVAIVDVGTKFRTGAATLNGHETVIGTTMMLLGQNSREVAERVKTRIAEIQTKLPDGVEIRIQYDRSELINRTIHTVRNNLFEGAILVVAVLLLLLGKWRAALIVALAIPLSFLFALMGMERLGISGNLMSLGAIDFGLIIDGAVVIVENIVRQLAEKQHHLGRALTTAERSHVVLAASKQVGSPMFFGVVIITAVYVRILALTGIEGKMFHPMALAVMLALTGALLLTLTLMPVLCSLLLRGRMGETDNFIIRGLKAIYRPVLKAALMLRWVVVIAALAVFAGSIWLFNHLGAEFIPKLDEGSITSMLYKPVGMSLEESLRTDIEVENTLLHDFPEITRVFTRIGTSDIATDPMPPNESDVYIFYKPISEWPKTAGRPRAKAELNAQIGATLKKLNPNYDILSAQPIEMRFNELLQRYALQASEVNKAVNAALAGQEAGQIIEGNRRYDIVVRMPEELRIDDAQIKKVPLRVGEAGLLPLGDVVEFQTLKTVEPIRRDEGQRRAALMVNLKTRNVEGFVREAERQIKEQVKMPEGYLVEFGGQYQHLQEARMRLAVVVPATLALIFILVFMSFRSVRQTLIIYTGVPLAATGGVLALWICGMPFSISAAVGFIALSGVAVLDGLVMLSYFNELREEGKSVRDAVIEGSLTRLRPVLMTALVASFGFVPMALATGAGAEVQKPLAIVVIGGLLSSMFLKLILLPVLYAWFERERKKKETGVAEPARELVKV